MVIKMRSEEVTKNFKMTFIVAPVIDIILKECSICGQEVTEPLYLKSTLSLEPHGGETHLHVHLEPYHVRCLVNDKQWFHVPSIAWSENSLYLLIKNTPKEE